MNDTKKVLIVEDDEFTRFMMRSIVHALGVDVDVAEGGEEGCSRICNNPEAYGLILMDIHMSGVNGVEATNRIRALPDDPPRDVPIIAVTSDARYLNDDMVESIGMNGYASKPLTAGNLLSFVQDYCEAPKSGP